MTINEIKSLPENTKFFGECTIVTDNKIINLYHESEQPLSSRETIINRLIDDTISEITWRENKLDLINQTIPVLEKIINDKELYQKMWDLIETTDRTTRSPDLIPKPFESEHCGVSLNTVYKKFCYTYRFDILSDLTNLKWKKIELKKEIKRLKATLC